MAVFFCHGGKIHDKKHQKYCHTFFFCAKNRNSLNFGHLLNFFILFLGGKASSPRHKMNADFLLSLSPFSSSSISSSSHRISHARVDYSIHPLKNTILTNILGPWDFNQNDKKEEEKWE